MPKRQMRILLFGMGILLGMSVYGSSLLVNHMRRVPQPKPVTWTEGMEFTDMQMPTDVKTFDPFTETISVEVDEVEQGYKITSEGFCYSKSSSLTDMVCYRQQVVAYLREYNPVPWKGQHFLVPVRPFSMFIPIPEDMVP